MNCKTKSFITKRKAFTLIELLIVIAIIGILFIVLISKVDFATDKAKATGVQTDFRSFQVAIETVAKENAGLATFGWDTGDTNGDRVRNSYDKGDTNQNGKQDDGEVFIGSKTYGETWTNVYTLTNPADANDTSAIIALESAINANLDLKLHIRIHDDLTITMANGAQDPWNTEYHGYYITNATTDGKDRGAIVIYSNGANQEWGSEHSIANGVVVVNVPGNNVYGKDDYSLAVTYTYVNGYGEVKTTTTGFSQNQGGGQAGTDGTFTPGGNGGPGNNGAGGNGNINNDIIGDPTNEFLTSLRPGLYATGALELAEAGDYTTADSMLVTTWDELLATNLLHVSDEGVLYTDFDNVDWYNQACEVLDGDLVLPNDGSITSLGDCIADFETYEMSGRYAFTDCYNLTGITIPSSVVELSSLSFMYCESLNKVVFAGYSQLKTIGVSAFEGCYNIASLELPNSVTYVDMWAFNGCDFDVNEYNNALYLGAVNNPYFVLLYYIDPSQTNMEIHPETRIIYSEAFGDYYGLEYINIPDKVVNIGHNAFGWCENLKEVHITDLLSWCSISFGKYESNPLYYAEHLYLNGDIISGNIVLSAPAKTIPAFTFKNSTITSIVLSNSITSIGDYAFAGCTGLTDCVIPESVDYVGYAIFTGCSSLESLTIPFTGAQREFEDPEAPERLFGYIFGTEYYDGSYEAYHMWTTQTLQQIICYIPESLTTVVFTGNKIHSFAFNDCEFENLIIGDNVESIGLAAFFQAKITNLTLGTGLKFTDEAAFYSTEIENLYLTNMNKFFNVLWGPNAAHPTSHNLVNLYLNNQLVTDYTFASDLTEIPDGALSGVISIVNITIPKNITHIGQYAFSGCSNLRNVKMNEGLKTIGERAFYDCENLAFIDFPNSLESIDEYAFYSCQRLSSVSLPSSLTTIGNSAFSGCGIVEIINHSNLELEAGSSNYGYIASGAFEIHNGNRKVENQNGYIMYSYNSTNYLLCHVGFETNLVLPESYHGQSYVIDNGAFYYDDIVSVVIPDSVTKIGSSAFLGCKQLVDVTIGNGITKIEDEAFRYANLSGNVILGNNVETIGQYAFYETSMQKIVIPDSVKYINYGAFIYSRRLIEVVMHGVVNIDTVAFRECGFTTLTLPVTTKYLGYRVFLYCDVTTIIYEGTMQQWNSISKNSSWNDLSDITTIQCTDGTITLK